MAINIHTIDPEKLCFPLVAHKENQARFVGTATALNVSEGEIITCAHILDNVKQDEQLCLAVNKKKGFFPLENICRHPKIDLLVAVVNKDCIKGSLINLTEQLNGDLDIFPLGLPVRAFGYVSSTPIASVPSIMVVTREGYICVSTDSSEDTHNLGGASRREVSFSSPEGFSGGPMLLNTLQTDEITPIGVCFNNIATELARWELEERTEGSKTYKEVRLRVEEHGLFHPLCDIKKALFELGKTAQKD